MSVTSRISTILADRYRIERHIGEGGMATVYLAHDVKHNRKVALKVLRPELAAVIGAERFLKEIEVTANLQHPHILPLFDSGTAGEEGRGMPRPFLYYVMPFIDGDTLRDKLNRETQLSIDEAVRIAADVADALDYAHRNNVIHRDIKPENILVHEGQALVADFGIALAVSQAGASRLTETGLSIGTPQYMSPEQAMGDRELDARSDVYSLGAMLYEMLVGEPPFTGPTAQSIVAKVITEKPAVVTAARPTTPRHVELAIHKALEKLPADRFHSAAEFADALTRPSAAPIVDVLQREAGSPIAAFAARGSRVPWALFAMAVVAIAALSWQLARNSGSVPRQSIRFVAELPANAYVDDPQIKLSRDGSLLVVTAKLDGRSRLLLRRLDQVGFEPIAGSDDAIAHYLSPDARWVAFRAGGFMKKVLLEGGSAVVMDESQWGGGSWREDGMIVYSQSYRSGLWLISAEGGEAERITTPDHAGGELAHWWPQILPDGDHVVFTNFSTPIERARIEVLSLSTGERKVLVNGAVSAMYVSSGHLLYVRNELMFAVPFDVDRLETTGLEVPVLEDVAMDHPSGLAAYDVSDNGTLVYMQASVFNQDTDLKWVDRRGREEQVTSIPAMYEEPALSPDGRRIAVSVSESGSGSDLWILDLTRDTRTPLTRGGGDDFAPVWTPDGRRVIYSSEQPVFDLYWRPSDGSLPAAPLVTSEFDKRVGSLTPDGSQLLFTNVQIPTSDIWVVPLAGGEPTPVSQSDFALLQPALSPDGKWLAYTSDETGRMEVYLSPYPDVTASRKVISRDGGQESRWTRRGREIVYRSGERMMSVAVDPATGDVGAPQVLFIGSYLYSRHSTYSYDVTPDGNRFLMVSRPLEEAPRRIMVITDWFEELKERVGN